MMRKYVCRWSATLVISIAALAFAPSCGSPTRERPPQAAVTVDTPPPACDPTAGDDGDCNADGLESCQQKPPRDPDGDGGPDYLDGESDGDGILDKDEVGPNCAVPRDTDGD